MTVDFLIETAANTRPGPRRGGLVPLDYLRCLVELIVHVVVDGRTWWMPYQVLFPIGSTLDRRMP